MTDVGTETMLSLPLCDWCRTNLADGLLDGDPCCLTCADGLIIDGQPPLSVQLAIEERTRPLRPRDAPYMPTLEDLEAVPVNLARWAEDERRRRAAARARTGRGA